MPQRENPRVEGFGVAGADELTDAPDDDPAAVYNLDAAVV